VYEQKPEHMKKHLCSGKNARTQLEDLNEVLLQEMGMVSRPIKMSYLISQILAEPKQIIQISYYHSTAKLPKRKQIELVL
jgi:hypothetical protein